MKAYRFLLGIWLSLACFGTLMPQAQAHFLKSDGDIGAVLHIDPDDDPIIGQPASFFFEMKDKAGKFKLAECDCQASVLRAGSVIASQAITQADLSTASFTATLPQADVYQVRLSGQPLQAGEFQPFNLSWDVRADRTETTNPLSVSLRSIGAHGWHALLLGVAPITAIVLIEIQRRQPEKPKAKP